MTIQFEDFKEELECIDGTYASRAFFSQASSSVDSFSQLNRNAKEFGWRRALAIEYGEHGLVDYITNESRLKILSALPLSEEQRILEIGCGYGQMTGYIASKVWPAPGFVDTHLS